MLVSRNAKSAIDHIIANEGNGPSRGPPGMGGQHGGGGGFCEIIVAGHKVGLIIGKGGETIKHLQVLNIAFLDLTLHPINFILIAL